jgi:hypothetical protein
MINNKKLLGMVKRLIAELEKQGVNVKNVDENSILKSYISIWEWENKFIIDGFKDSKITVNKEEIK